MEFDEQALKIKARYAGLLYLILGITSAYGLSFFPSNPISGCDVATTVEKIVLNEFMLRTKLISNLVSAIMFILLAPVLYKLFKDINEYYSKLLVGFMIVQVPIFFILETFNLTAILIFKGEILKSLESKSVKEFGVLLLTMYKCGIVLLELFWGLWLIPFGVLVYKSLFIPRILGVFQVLGGIAYIIECMTIILFPYFRIYISPYVIVFFALAEFPIIIWLTIKGVSLRKEVQSHL